MGLRRKEIGAFTKLIELGLENNNQLTTLPEKIGELTSLRALFLSGTSLVYLPESFKKLLPEEGLSTGLSKEKIQKLLANAPDSEDSP